jgi:hypothetical protein
MFMIVSIAIGQVFAQAVAGADPASDAQGASANFSLRFLERDDGGKLLGKHDDFIDSLSPFDRQARLQATADPGTEAFLRATVEDVVDWAEDDRLRVQAAVKAVASKLADWKPLWPVDIVCICVGGKVESNAAYTRANAIVLPRDKVRAGGPMLERLVTHELFHVISRAQPALRKSLYRIIGFEVCPPIDAPPKLAPSRIANPDAPLWDCVLKVRIDEQEKLVTPILFATPPDFAPGQGRGLFQQLTFKLLEVEADPKKPEHYLAVQADDSPVLHDPRLVEDFANAIGGNTKYIIHPDEVLADNFVHAVFKTPDLPTPAIIEKFRSTWDEHEPK